MNSARKRVNIGKCGVNDYRTICTAQVHHIPQIMIKTHAPSRVTTLTTGTPSFLRSFFAAVSSPSDICVIQTDILHQR